MIGFFRIINGYLRVIFYGEFSEKILNLAANNRITVWDTKLIKKGIETSISVKDFKRLPDILRHSGIRVHILKRYGLPFKTFKNRKRIGLVAGVLLFFVFLKFMSGFIWMVDVVGNQKVEEKEILQVCEILGIKSGIRKNKLNTKIEREKLLLELDSLAWASLNVEGCLLTINVSEIKKGAEDNGCCCNLKSKADGIIKKVDVTSGNCVVRVGDTVKKGDVLVSGILEKATGTQFVHSAGVIMAETERSITVSGKYKDTLTEENGEKKVKRVFQFFNIKIPVFLGTEQKSYNSSITEKELSLFGRNLPIKVYSKEFRFTDKYERNLSKESLTKILYSRLEKQLKKEKIENYEIKSQEIKETEGGLSLTAIVLTEENIVYRESLIVKGEESF